MSRSLQKSSLLLLWAAALGSVLAIWLITRDTRDLPDALWRTYFASTVLANLAATAVILAAAYVGSGLYEWRARVGRTLLAGFGVALAVAILELPVIALGHDYGISFGTRSDVTWLQLAMGVNRRDDELIHVHQPHTRYTGTVVGNLSWLGLPARPPYQVDVQYDGNGFRNSQDLSRAEVVAIGDSFVEAAETPESLSVTSHIARTLGTSVANLGQSSYGPQQELAVLRRFGLPLSPRVVVWFFFGGNDLSDVSVYEWRRAHLDEFLAPPSRAARSFTRNAILAIARLTTLPRRDESPLAARHAADFKTASGEIERIYLDAEEGSWTSHEWDVAASTLREADQVVRKAGAELLVVYVPRKLRVYQGFIQSGAGSAAQAWQNNELPQVMGDWCKVHGIAYLDSTTSLRAAVAAGRSVYLPDDVHWSPAGHEVAGRAIADAIAKSVNPVALAEFTK